MILASEHARAQPQGASGLLSDRRLLASGSWKIHPSRLQPIAVVKQLALRLGRPRHPCIEETVHTALRPPRSVQIFLESACALLFSVTPSADGCSLRRTRFSTRRSAGSLGRAWTPICSVGDTLEQYERGSTNDVAVGQVTAVLREVYADVAAGVVSATGLSGLSLRDTVRLRRTRGQSVQSPRGLPGPVQRGDSESGAYPMRWLARSGQRCPAVRRAGYRWRAGRRRHARFGPAHGQRDHE